MQLKAVKVRGRVYYSIVESVRINGKPRHRYVKYLGSRDKLIESLLKGDELTIKAVKVPEVLDYGDVAALDYFYPDEKDKAVEIEKDVVKKLKELFGIKMNCLYYDITSTYFEGNETDITTVGRAISRLKAEFTISNCLIIFDRGMVSEENVGELDESGYEFICDLKKNKEVKAVLREVEDAELLKGQNHVQISEKGFYAVERVRELYGRKRKVVICYDAKIAALKKRERDENLKRAEEELSAYLAKLAGENYREID